MKLLVIGIDGGDQRIFEHMEMPFFHELMKKNTSVKLEEDLWTRGWAEVFSGELGAETGAFYAKPVLNENEYKFTQSFKSTNYNDNEAITPLWKLLNDNGLKTGFMNFPTTAPLPKTLNGFMITGAGGGISQKGIGSAPESACYPKGIKKVLDEGEYIFDIRFKVSGIRTLSVLVDNLINMHTKRVDNFIKLNKDFNPDVGGVAFMSTSRIQNLAMYDIEKYIEDKEYDRFVISHLKMMYSSLDENLRRLFDEINPDDFLIISDHGAVPRRGTINLNQFLEKNDFLQFQNPLIKFSKKVLNKLNQISGKKPNFGLPINREGTKAFTGRYISGIYINDTRRFNGPVSEKDIDNYVNEIIDKFNVSPITKEYELSARPYRRYFKEAFKYDLLPDIWVDRPDNLFFEAKGEFVEQNHEFGPLKESLKHVTRDQYTGAKGRYPLFICSPSFSNYIQNNDDRNLTLAYKVIERYISNKNNNNVKNVKI